MTRWFENDRSNATNIIKSDQGCPRCGGAVYEAEKIMATENLIYHKQCSTCRACNVKLDSGTLCNGNDCEIYCQKCHTRKFGGASFRGATSTWMNEEAASNMRYCQNIDTSKIKITNDPGN